jgi:hypothetical protein
VVSATDPHGRNLGFLDPEECSVVSFNKLKKIPNEIQII